MTWPSTQSSETRSSHGSRAGSITRLCSGKNGSKSELLVLHQGNPVCGAEWPEQSCCRSRIEAAILRPTQDGRTRAPGPNPT